MIDTVKFKITNLSDVTLQSLKEFLTYSKKQNVLRDVLIEFYNHSENIGSYNSNILFFYSPSQDYLYIELSLPKFWQGHNVYMIYNETIEIVIQLLYSRLSQIFQQFPAPSLWEVVRLDICYNYILPDHNTLLSYLSLLKKISYPRHKMYLYDSSCMSVGSSYSIKFYDKGSEYYKHDYKRIVKINPDKAHILRLISENCLRFEVSLRKRYIKDNFKRLFADQLPFLKYHEMLNDKISKFLQYNTNKTTNSTTALESLLNMYDSAKAIKLYTYWMCKYTDEAINFNNIKSVLNRSTISRYNNDLRRANIGILSNVTLPPLAIPSDFRSN